MIGINDLNVRRPFTMTDSVENVRGSETILVERRDAVTIVTLNRPERRNAFDAAQMERLASLWRELADDDGVRCVVLTGAGPGFCAGADMTLLEGREEGAATAKDELAFLPGGILACPVIAAVNGVCAGGGLHFVADADIAIASDRASFIDPHVSVGQVTALEPLQLALRVRQDVLVRMALLGRHERLDAGRALDAGLISEVVPHEQLLDRALELAGQIASNSPAAVRLSRQALRSLETEILEASMERGWDLIRSHWKHPDAAEGPRAFEERREPNWQ
jgi:enoyl-CoA hydratase/carnithine racemase